MKLNKNLLSFTVKVTSSINVNMNLVLTGETFSFFIQIIKDKDYC